jgi:hypothetical protein
MNTSKQFLTFLKTLRTLGNAELLECIEQGFSHVMAEGMTYGNIYAHQIGPHNTPNASTVGGVMAAPADMITEDSEKDCEMSGKRKKREKALHKCAVNKK